MPRLLSPRPRVPRLRPPAAAPIATAAALAVAAVLTATPALAEGGGGAFAPPQDKVVQKECSACHMAYSPGMLPARSWRKIMADLGNHFGEDASLDKATTQHIADYLVAHAADAGGRRSWAMRGLKPTDVPLRITDTPWWVRAHWGEVPASAFKDPRVGSKANCAACHRGAAMGMFGEEE